MKRRENPRFSSGGYLDSLEEEGNKGRELRSHLVGYQGKQSRQKPYPIVFKKIEERITPLSLLSLFPSSRSPSFILHHHNIYILPLSIVASTTLPSTASCTNDYRSLHYPYIHRLLHQWFTATSTTNMFYGHIQPLKVETANLDAEFEYLKPLSTIKWICLCLSLNPSSDTIDHIGDLERLWCSEIF